MVEADISEDKRLRAGWNGRRLEEQQERGDERTGGKEDTALHTSCGRSLDLLL